MNGREERVPLAEVHRRELSVDLHKEVYTQWNDRASAVHTIDQI